MIITADEYYSSVFKIGDTNSVYRCSYFTVSLLLISLQHVNLFNKYYNFFPMYKLVSGHSVPEAFHTMFCHKMSFIKWLGNSF